MTKFPMKNIRNYALVGSSGSGKTTLAELMLNNAGATNRIGKVEDGTTTMDFNKQERERHMSVCLSTANFNWKKVKHNIIDSPGYADFKGDMITSLQGVETALIVIESVVGTTFITEQVLEYAEDLKNSKAIVINKMDRENAKFEQIVDSMSNICEEVLVPVLIPIGSSKNFKGVINTITKKAYSGNKSVDIPEELKDKVDEYHEKLIEAAAESDDKMMEKYFEEGSLSEEEMHMGLKKSIIKGIAIPIFACSATNNIGVIQLLNLINNFFPSAEDINSIQIEKKGEKTELDLNSYDKKLGYVIKSISEKNLGDVSIIRMYSGSLKTGDEIEIASKLSKEKVGQMYHLVGNKRRETESIETGDIGGLVKLKTAKTNDSINEKGENIIVKPYELPHPVYWKRIKAQTQSDEDKIGAALNKLKNEDPSISSGMDKETKQNILSGQGEVQIDIVIKRLKNDYNITASLSTPRIPYRETIQGKADVSYKHKKQTGGHGQYGEVFIKIKPRELGTGFEFVNSIVGGVIPSKFIPAVEKGLVEKMKDGILAGYPVVDISVELYDGSFHDVDSSEMAFKIAARNALKDGFMKAKPILLEPIHKVQIILPTECMGDVMGGISSIRGKILGMSQKGKRQIINAELPLSELYGYYTSLKSLTQGRGYFTQEFGYYQKLPDDLAKKVIEESQKDK